MLAAYARFIVRNSYLVMFIVGIISTTLTLIPLVCHQLPSFSDPIIGFETRGTSLAHRFISWENLIDETRPSRRLAVNPKEIEDQIRMNLSYHNIVNHNIRFGNGRKKERKNKKIRNNSTKFAKTSYKSSDLKVTQNHVHWSFGKNVSFEDEETAFLRNHTWRQWKSLKEMQLIPLNFTQHNYASGICGAPMSDYAHLVVSSLDGASLLNYENIMEICELQSMLVQVGSTAYTKICQRSSLSEELCCPIWSVPNYISILSGLQLPNTKQFQLFQKTHPFEQYDHEYSQHYLFEKFTRDTGMVITMPLRWIWGIKAIDNGSHMDPSSRGKLMFDEHFNISDPKSQVWLSNFCSDLKIQNFYQHTGPLLPNCFIESFKMYMSRQCYDVIDKLNRTPCCESSHFPYSKDVFDYCIIKAMESLYQTPREIFMPGIAGPKFLRSSRPPTVAAIVVEFESNVPYSMSYKDMNDFFINVENWTQHTLKFAPEGMKNGWFISDLQFYDLQKTLASGTVMALLLSAALGFIVLLPSTFSFVVSLCALIAMIFSATVTIATLVLIGWKLNVLESVSISLSAGLAVDFSLHYALSYTNANGTKAARVKYALCASSGPTAAAALTTGCSGIFLLFSNLLPYSQIGLFLFLIMLISWFYATFFLCSMLHVFGSNTTKETLVEEKKAESKVSSICSDVPDLESHELEHLAESNRTNITTSHSPSNISATTVVLHEDFEKKIEDTTHD
ncbi:unnamed protein product [Leptidea sinapis]|uniref:SSD domain-containing protein n=1 Tax=Leptidea sinapis TaxID=189913 RepID=A0A5E4R180_9NEOP|nr:unnamed protein product [Leptidea sinapis]